MKQFRLLLVILLVVQLLMGPSSLAWGQASRGDKGKEGRSRASQGVGQPKGGRFDQGGLRQGSEGGVQSLQPALDRLPGGAALSRAVMPDRYVLGPGDALTVNLWGEFESLYEVRVTPDGKISLPTMGDLKVKGLSLTQAEALIETEVKRYYRNVKTGVALTSLRVFEVSVLGAVQLPGTYLATPVKRVSDLVAEAGGIMAGGSWRKILVRWEGKTVATADLTAFLRRGDEMANPYLNDGLVIFVPPIEQPVVALITNDVTVSPQTGIVTENSIPSDIELKQGERLSQLVEELGSISPWWNLEGAYVVRETQIPEGTMKIPVNLRRLVFDRDETQNIEMRNGDQVFIPSNVRRVFVNGVVRTGGAFPYVPGRTAEEYLGLAGGVSLQASLDRSTIQRSDGTIEPFRSNAVLMNGDSIQVAQKYFASPSDYIGIIGGLTSLVFSGFAFATTLK